MLGRGTDKDAGNGQRTSDVGQQNRPVALTVFGDRAKVEGKFEIPDSIQVECEIEGQLNIGGKLIIGQNGYVNADVETTDAVIEGQYEGNLKATGDVRIMATGRVMGNLETNSLVIAHGAFFNGNVARLEDYAEKETPLHVLDQQDRVADGPSTAGRASRRAGRVITLGLDEPDE